MGWLAAQGAIMAIGLFIGLVCSVIGLFFGHIINDNRSIGASKTKSWLPFPS